MICLHACILPPPFEFLGASTSFQRFQNNSFNRLLAITYRTDISSVNWDMTCHQKEVQKYLSITKEWWIPWYMFYFQSLCIWSQSGKKVNYSLLSQSVHYCFCFSVVSDSATLWTGWISLLSKGLSRVFNTTVQKHQFFGAQLYL